MYYPKQTTHTLSLSQNRMSGSYRAIYNFNKSNKSGQHES